MRTVMKKTVFVVYSLILFSCFLESYFYFRFHFSGVDQLQVKVTQLEAGVEQERLRTLLAQSELLEYQEQIATLMPDVLKKTGMPSKENYELRSLASVVEKTAAVDCKLKSPQACSKPERKNFVKNNLMIRLIRFANFSDNIQIQLMQSKPIFF
jgi:hypothetical protein